MRLDRAMSIEDLRRMAKRNVPGVFFEYMEAGSYSEHTRDANVDDMRAIKLRQRVLVDMSRRSLKTTVLGEELSVPLAIAPTGLSGMLHAGQSGRRDRERNAQLLAQHRSLEAAPRHVDQHALAQLDRAHVVHVGVARVLRIGARLHVLEEHARHVALGH